MKRGSDEWKGFVWGVAYCTAQLLRQDNASWAEYLWSESGLSADDLKLAGVEDYDAGPMRSAIATGFGRHRAMRFK